MYIYWEETTVNIKKCTYAILAAAVLSAASGCSKTENVMDSAPDPLAVKTAPENVAFDWQSAYEEKPKEFKASGDCSDSSMFELLDLTGDGTPELIISPSDDVSSQCEIYTLTNKTTDRISTCGSFGEIDFIPSKNAIGYQYTGEGFTVGEYQVFENGSFNAVANFFNNVGSASSGAVIRYVLNENNVSLSEYEAAIIPYRDSPSVKAGRKYTFGDDAINYAVHYSESWSSVMTDLQKYDYRARLLAVLDNTMNPGYAFELVDLDVNGLPEVVVSTGLLDESPTRVFYLGSEGVKDLEVSSDTEGGIHFDISKKIFYSTDANGSIQCWSLAGADVNSFAPSDSTMCCGRKYELTKENIELVFA